MPRNQAVHSSSRQVDLKSAVRFAVQAWGLVPTRTRLTFALAGALALAAGAAQVAVLACLAWLIQGLQSDPAPTAAGWGTGGLLASYLGLAGLAFLAGEAVRLVSTCIVRRACARLKRQLTVAAVARQHRADLAALLAEPVGARLERTLGGVEGLTRLLSVAFLDLLPAAGVLVFALGYAFVMQPLIGLLLACAAPALLVVSARRMAGQQGVRRTSHQRRERVDGMLAEQFSGIEHIRAANTEGQEVRRVAGVLEGWRREQLRLYLRTASFHSLTTLSGWLFQFAVIALAVALSGMGKMPVGAVAIYGNLFFSVYVPLWRIHWAVQEAQEAGPRVEAFLEILAEPADRSFTVSDAAAPAAGAPAVEVRDVVVEYRDAEGQARRALDGVSLRIGAGELVGVAGPSGSGKSTLARLLLRLAHPAASSVRLAGTPLECLSRAELGRLAAYVGQSPFLFAGSVADNIAYGCGAVTPADIERAAKLAGIHGEVVARPGGYAAAVAEGGRNLSGGQRQRLALARAFLKGAPLLVLDEATSALDPAAQRRVLWALARRGGRTVVFVTHRLASLRGADRVLVLDGGRLAEEGTYDELARRGGTFARLLRHSRRRAARTSQGLMSADEVRCAGM